MSLRGGEKKDTSYCPCALGVGSGGKSSGWGEMDGGGVGGMDGGEGGDLVILDGGKRWRVRGEVIYGMAEELGTA